MIRLLIAVLLVTSFEVMAQKLLLNEFEDGKPAKAAEVNYNFDALNNQITSNDDEFEQFRANTEIVLPPSDCSKDQIIKWNGSAWVCVTEPVRAFFLNEDLTTTLNLDTALPNSSVKYDCGADGCDFYVYGQDAEPLENHGLCVVQASGRAANDPDFTIQLYLKRVRLTGLSAGELHITFTCF